MLFKTFGTDVKLNNPEEGFVEAIVSVFGNKDRGGEVVMKGFFTESLQKKLPKGVWGHNWSQPIAKTVEAKELDPGDALLPEHLKQNGGLYIKGQFNLETQRGREAYSDLKFGNVDEFSFGYEVLEERWDKATRTNYLIKGNIFEWSPVLIGMNPDTALIRIHGANGTENSRQKFLEQAKTARETVEALVTRTEKLINLKRRSEKQLDETRLTDLRAMHARLAEVLKLAEGTQTADIKTLMEWERLKLDSAILETAELAL